MKRFLIPGITLFLLLVAVSAVWSWRVSTARVRRFEQVLLTIALLPDPPVIAAAIPVEDHADAEEYTRRTAAALAQQINATLTPVIRALLEKFPSPESERAFENIDNAKAADEPATAVELYRDALTDLAPALDAAHQAQYSPQFREIQDFAQKALAENAPLLAVIPLRALAVHRPNNRDVLNLLSRAEAELTDHLQRYFLLHENKEEAAAFKKIADAIKQAADANETLCVAALALTKNPPDLDAVALHLPFLEQNTSPAAPYLLALYHEHTDAPDATLAKLYLSAVKLGFLPANFPAALHILYTMNRGNLALGVALLTAAAKANHPAAQRELALLYLGRHPDIEPDAALAHHWFVQAANRGDARAQTNLALLLLDGLGAEQDIDAAVYWLRKAEKQNDPVALYNLGLLALRRIPRDVNENDAARYIRLSAEAGFAPAQRYLAGFHAEGRFNIPKNPALAFQWAQKAADQNDPASLLFLGLMHANGIGAPVNPAAAAVNIIKAAQLDFPDAMFAAGLLYAEGQGVSQNLDKAREWITKARDAGYPQAAEWLKENNE